MNIHFHCHLSVSPLLSSFSLSSSPSCFLSFFLFSLSSRPLFLHPLLPISLRLLLHLFSFHLHFHLSFLLFFLSFHLQSGLFVSFPLSPLKQSETILKTMCKKQTVKANELDVDVVARVFAIFAQGEEILNAVEVEIV